MRGAVHIYFVTLACSLTCGLFFAGGGLLLSPGSLFGHKCMAPSPHEHCSITMYNVCEQPGQCCYPGKARPWISSREKVSEVLKLGWCTQETPAMEALLSEVTWCSARAASPGTKTSGIILIFKTLPKLVWMEQNLKLLAIKYDLNRRCVSQAGHLYPLVAQPPFSNNLLGPLGCMALWGMNKRH